MVNNSASVVVMLTTLWIVLMTDLSYEWMCNIDVVTQFLIPALNITIEEKGFDDALNVRLSRSLMCFLIFEEHRWKGNLSEKELTRQFSRLNSLSKKEKKERSLLCLLSMSIKEDFRYSLCLGVRLLMEILWELCLYDPSELRILLMMWLGGSNEPLRRNLPYNFVR